ncbi:MAG: polyphosphate kinase 2 family protein [Cryobacterium sp.]|nr:polyphosphate kinase 2 family protein [Micrococcales bacterium]MBX3311241.1 polyphosphate kinase 2 family protein [Cryobacterium sp.]
MSKPEWTADPAPLLAVGDGFQLSEVDPRSTPGFDGGKRDGEHLLEAEAPAISELQERLYAESRTGGMRRVLLILQAMDTAGKGGVIRHVVGAIDPQGTKIYGFKKPTPEELSHDFLWRVRRQVPGPGIVGVFDRSHYEDVLIGRVRHLAPPEEIEARYGQIVEFERELIADGTTIIKAMLHISSVEQKARLGERLDRDDKHWKYNPGDIDERLLWPDYQNAYQIALERTSTPEAPWFVVPADRKWYARIAVQRLLLDALRRLDPQWPTATFDVAAERKRLAAS